MEDSAGGLAQATSIKEWSEAWAGAERNLRAACSRCQEAAQDLFATRDIFKGVASHAGEARPWFSTRLMAAIAERERELTDAARTWLAVPKFASRLAAASVALLL